jgi:hypothetical protein
MALTIIDVPAGPPPIIAIRKLKYTLNSVIIDIAMTHGFEGVPAGIVFSFFAGDIEGLKAVVARLFGRCSGDAIILHVSKRQL